MSRQRLLSARLRHRLSLQEEVRTPDNQGGYVRSWQEIAKLWAEIAPISDARSKEYFSGDQLQASVTHRITLRYRTDVNAGQRLVFDSRVFNIRSVVNVKEENRILELQAEEGVL